jgi:predicted GH43/DUF377 family glycosyl hydrolase
MDKEPPSILEQTKFEVGLYDFPDEQKLITSKSSSVRHFNCGLVSTDSGLKLITRRMEKKNLKPFKSTIWEWNLVGNVPTNGFPLHLPHITAGDNYEDPRAIVHRGNVHVSYCNVIAGCYAHQVIVNLAGNHAIRPQFGNNADCPSKNLGHEKNWIWFSHNDELHFIYQSMPHMVVSIHDSGAINKVYMSPKMPDSKKEWKFGQHRGGTPPIKVGDEYFCFFHSSLPFGNTRRYYAGAYAFEAKPPFKITRVTKKPILMGSLNDIKNHASPPVVFPCGSHFDGKEWLVVGGMNDVKCFWIKIPHDELLKLL